MEDFNIPDTIEALKTPYLFELTLSVVGWTLVRNDVSLCVSESFAFEFIAATKRDKEEFAAEQARLDEENV